MATRSTPESRYLNVPQMRRNTGSRIASGRMGARARRIGHRVNESPGQVNRPGPYLCLSASIIPVAMANTNPMMTPNMIPPSINIRVTLGNSSQVGRGREGKPDVSTFPQVRGLVKSWQSFHDLLEKLRFRRSDGFHRFAFGSHAVYIGSCKAGTAGRMEQPPDYRMGPNQPARPGQTFLL